MNKEENMNEPFNKNKCHAAVKRNIKINGAKILIMGLTFKENCADVRNSGIQSVVPKLKKFKCNIAKWSPVLKVLSIR